MAICKDPRHDEPCQNCETCSGCMEECETRYWFEDDGTPWGDVGLALTGHAKTRLTELTKGD